MQRRLVWFLLGIGWILFYESAQARPARPSQIPNGSAFGCANCHVNPSGGGSRNAFGQTIENSFLNGTGFSATVNWNASLAGMDSDGDGFSNGTELGDPDGDGNPMSGVTVTNPGDAQSFPQTTNTAPVIGAIDPQAVSEGETLSFDVTASDEDGDTLTFSASGLPEGATFEDGTFAWTPGFDVGDSTVTVTVSVSDGTDEASRTVDIAVANVNRPATLNSADPSKNTVVAASGTSLTFSVDAADPDGEALTFTWTVNGTEEPETSDTLMLTVPETASDDAVSVTVASVDGTTVSRSWTITSALIGDFDDTGDVGFSDFLLFTENFGLTSSSPDFNPIFDLDDSGDVGFSDFLRFVEFFGLSG